jgi:hypothetical protein
METVFTTRRLERHRVEITMRIKSSTGEVMAIYTKKFHESVRLSEACRELMGFAEEWEFPSVESVSDEDYACTCDQCTGSDYG